MTYVFQVWQDNDQDADQSLAKNLALDAIEKYLKEKGGLDGGQLEKVMADVI